MKTLSIIAFILGFIMVSLDLNPSWSQYARTLEEPILFGCLISIGYSFLLRSQKALNKDFVVFKNTTVGNLDYITALVFGLVLVFPVTHPEKFIEVLHFVFTGLAIAIAYINLVLQKTDKMMKIGTRFSFVFACIAFPVGLFTNLYNVATGEILVTVALLIHILNTKT